QILPGCDLFVHPTFADALPTVVMEAMASSLPVIASRVGGIPEMIDEGKTGLLVPPDDIDALERALRSMLEKSLVWRRHPACASGSSSDLAQSAGRMPAPHEGFAMGERARNEATRRFSIGAWTQRLDAIYDAALPSA